MSVACPVVLWGSGQPAPCGVARAHHHCAYCARELETDDLGGSAVCRWHNDGDSEWHVVNRAMCNFIHRRVPMVRCERPEPNGVPDDGGVESIWEM